MDNPDNKSVKENILAAIEAGKVQMRPKWQFVLRGVLLALGTILSILTLIYVISFIIFIFHQTGVWFIPGVRGAGLLFSSLPWILVVVAIAFVFILEILVKRYSFSYRKPLLYSTVGVVVLVFAGGFIVAQTPFHRGLFESARNNRLPVGGIFYRQFGMPRPPENVALGVVSEVIEKGYRIEDPRGEFFEAIMNDQTEFPTGRDIVADDHVVVLGERYELTILAKSIRKVDADDFPLPPPPRPPEKPLR